MHIEPRETHIRTATFPIVLDHQIPVKQLKLRRAAVRRRIPSRRKTRAIGVVADSKNLTPRLAAVVKFAFMNCPSLDALRVASAPNGGAGDLHLIAIGLENNLRPPVAPPFASPFWRRRRFRRRELERRARQPARGLGARLRFEYCTNKGAIRCIHENFSPGTRNALSLQAPPADGQPGVRLPGPAMKFSFASVVTTRASETLSCALSQSASAARAETTKNVRTIADGPARQRTCLRLRIDGAPQLAADLVLMLSRLRVPSMQDEAVYPEAMRRSG